MNNAKFLELVDEFSERVHEVLDAENPWLAEKLLSLRRGLRDEDARESSGELWAP